MRALLVAGGLFVFVIIVTVSLSISHRRSNSDLVVQSCAVHGSDAEATVVVTNHGSGTASYRFDVVFSQNQSQIVAVPLDAQALLAGNSETLHADSGSPDIFQPFTCTITNLQRLAGGSQVP